ncbi:hypothetical protein JTB14_003873 [Gonioctena quinquepunctata]|nr:hypothetical protein JTB14_003873 [Gonioctena quinquepunctata]
MLINSERLSNAPAERWFGVLKNILMDKNMSQKCSRVVRKLRKYTLFICKEANLKIPKLKRDGKTMSVDESTPDLASQEVWQKKNKSIKNNFLRNTLKRTLNECPTDVINDTQHPCIYCGGFLDETAYLRQL